MQIPLLDSSCRKHSFDIFNVPFAPFSRSFSYTFTPAQNFGTLTISWNHLGYRHVIVKWIPGLDSPSRHRSLETLNVPFASFSRPLSYTFTPGQNFAPLSISWSYSGYRHAIAKWIPGLDSPSQGHSFEPLNIPFASISSPLSKAFTPGRNFEPLTISESYSGYMHVIAKRIPGIDSPPQGHSLKTLNISFSLVSKPSSYTCTPGLNFGPLTIS